MERVTIRTVAAEAGVSPATVSRVLNRPERVEAHTRAKVIAAMERLGFQPSALAQGLSRKVTQAIGVLVPGLVDFFFPEWYESVSRAAERSGRRLLLFDAKHSAQRTEEGFAFLAAHRVDGILFCSRPIDPYLPLIRRLNVPVVLALTQSARDPVTAFKVDDVKAMFDAVAYLISRGHEQIALISGPPQDSIAGTTRLQGYRQALRHFRLPLRTEWIGYGGFRFEDGYRAMQELLSAAVRPAFTAVVAASDEMALGAIRCLHDQGLRVPEDLSVMGFDDLRLARMTTPTLTTVAQPFAEIGERATEALIAAIDAGEKYTTGGIHYLPHRIVQRESVLPQGVSTQGALTPTANEGSES